MALVKVDAMGVLIRVFPEDGYVMFYTDDGGAALKLLPHEALKLIDELAFAHDMAVQQ